MGQKPTNLNWYRFLILRCFPGSNWSFKRSPFLHSAMVVRGAQLFWKTDSSEKVGKDFGRSDDSDDDDDDDDDDGDVRGDDESNSGDDESDGDDGDVRVMMKVIVVMMKVMVMMIMVVMMIIVVMMVTAMMKVMVMMTANIDSYDHGDLMTVVIMMVMLVLMVMVMMMMMMMMMMIRSIPENTLIHLHGYPILVPVDSFWMAWQGLCSIAAGFASAFGWKKCRFRCCEGDQRCFNLWGPKTSHQKRDNIHNYQLLLLVFGCYFSLQVPSLSRNKDGLRHSVHGRSVCWFNSFPRLLFWNKNGWGVRSPELFGIALLQHEVFSYFFGGSKKEHVRDRQQKFMHARARNPFGTWGLNSSLFPCGRDGKINLISRGWNIYPLIGVSPKVKVWMTISNRKKIELGCFFPSLNGGASSSYRINLACRKTTLPRKVTYHGKKAGGFGFLTWYILEIRHAYHL